MNIDSLIAFVRTLPQTLAQQSAPEVAAAVHQELLVTIEAHQSPAGVPWAPRKRGTRPVLNNAADAVSSSGFGSRVYITVRGINARHHKGAVRGSVQRPIIMYKKDGVRALPPRIVAVIRAVLEKRFKAAYDEAKKAA
jgi:hypothetical protein